MRKRIAHFGAFDHDSYGDLLFPHLAEHFLGADFELVHVSPTGRQTPWQDAKPTVSVDQLSDDRRLNGLLIGGGDIIQDVTREDAIAWRQEGQSITALSCLWMGAGVNAVVRGIPLAWNAPGVPLPIRPSSLRLAGNCIQASQYVSVRDEQSRKHLPVSAQSSARVIPDSALLISRMWPELKANSDSPPYAVIDVAATAVDQLQDIAEVISGVKRHLGLETILQCHTPWQRPNQLYAQIAEMCEISAERVLVRPSSVKQSARIIAQSQLYIGSSLHGFITAVSYGVPAVLITPFASHKYAGFLQACGVEESAVRSRLFPNWAGLGQLRTLPQSLDIAPCAFESLQEHWRHLATVLRGGRTDCGEARRSLIHDISEDALAKVAPLGIMPGTLLRESREQLVAKSERVSVLESRTALLQAEVAELGAWGKRLDANRLELEAEVQRRGEWGTALEAKRQELEAEVQRLGEWARTLDAGRTKLEAEVQRLEDWGRNLDRNRIELEAEVQRHSEVATGFEDRVEALQICIDELQNEAEARRIGGLKLDAQIKYHLAKIRALEARRKQDESDLRHLHCILHRYERDGVFVMRKAVSLLWKSVKSLPGRGLRFARYAAPHLSLRNLLAFTRISASHGLALAAHKTYQHVAARTACLQRPHADRPRLDLPVSEQPLVSIIIPVYNQYEFTLRCLEAIRENTPANVYEVIIADDASTDETIRLAHVTPAVRIVRQEDNLGFLGNCNAAAAHARGKFLFFLNNDAFVRDGWLEPLLEVMVADEKVGLVGSKLLYPDGRLQEAGGIFWKDGSAWNYGNGDDPEKPQYNYFRQTDYVSGAAILVRADLWREIGGFDTRYSPAYCEDADLAFEIRKRGYTVMYQPRSVVEHHEGASHGTDADRNSPKVALMAANMAMFRHKWASALDREHFENGQNVFQARDRSAGRKTILVIDHYVPRFDRDAGSRCVDDYLQLFVKMGLNVKFIGDNFDRSEPYTTRLQQMGIEVLYGNESQANWRQWIKDHSASIHYAFLNRPHIAPNYIDYIRKNTRAKIIYYGHDLHSLRSRREAEVTGDAALVSKAQEWEERERDVFSKSDVVYYPSTVETSLVQRMMPGITARTIPLYIFGEPDPAKLNGFSTRRDLLFVGGFGHTPNVDAVNWFVKEVFPRIEAKIPGIRFTIAGSHPPPDVVELAVADRIIVTGAISNEQLISLYQSTRIVVVPLRYGAGVKGKVCESLFHGCPIVTTSIGAEGLPEVGGVLRIGDTAEQFASHVIELHSNPDLAHRMAEAGQRYAREHFSQRAALSVINQDIEPGRHDA